MFVSFYIVVTEVFVVLVVVQISELPVSPYASKFCEYCLFACLCYFVLVVVELFVALLVIQVILGNHIC